jgi:putative transposase
MRYLQPLFALFVSQTDDERIQTIEYLKVENRILRGKLPKRIAVTDRERSRLLELGLKLGSAINSFITIVSPRTFAGWVSAENQPKTHHSPTGPGRPRKAEEIRALVARLAQENAWGYTRIVGELKKLGVCNVKRTTIANILKEQGFDPAPKRG